MARVHSETYYVLKGGYNFRSISKSALAVTRVLMGEPPDRLGLSAATPHAVDTVQSVKLVQSRYWRSMYPKGKKFLIQDR
jgi:histone deacetylase 6